MKFSQEIGEISAALCKFRAVVTSPQKNKEGLHKAKYADLEAVIQAITPALVQSELTFFQNSSRNDKGETGVHTIILHKSGQYIEFDPVYVPGDTRNAHQEGSALTYAKRYSLSMAFGVAADDDDDATSIVPDKQPQQTTQRKQYQQKQPTQPKTAQPVAKMTEETLDKIKNVWESTSLAPQLINKQTDKYFKLPLNELSEEQGQKLLEIFAAKKSEGVEQKKNRYAGLFAAGKEQKLSQDQVKEIVYDKYSIESLTKLDDIKLAEATKWIKTYGQTKKIS